MYVEACRHGQQLTNITSVRLNLAYIGSKQYAGFALIERNCSSRDSSKTSVMHPDRLHISWNLAHGTLWNSENVQVYRHDFL
jgi:hypothetical protein